MAIFLTQFDVTLSDGSRKTYASEDIEANTLEEAQEIAKQAKGKDLEGHRAEFVRLVELAEFLTNDTQQD